MKQFNTIDEILMARRDYKDLRNSNSNENVKLLDKSIEFEEAQKIIVEFYKEYYPDGMFLGDKSTDYNAVMTAISTIYGYESDIKGISKVNKSRYIKYISSGINNINPEYVGIDCYRLIVDVVDLVPKYLLLIKNPSLLLSRDLLDDFGIDIFKYLDKKRKEICIKVLKIDGLQIQYINKGRRTKKMYKVAINQNINAIQYSQYPTFEHYTKLLTSIEGLKNCIKWFDIDSDGDGSQSNAIYKFINKHPEYINMLPEGYFNAVFVGKLLKYRIDLISSIPKSRLFEWHYNIICENKEINNAITYIPRNKLNHDMVRIALMYNYKCIEYIEQRYFYNANIKKVIINILRKIKEGVFDNKYNPVKYIHKLSDEDFKEYLSLSKSPEDIIFFCRNLDENKCNIAINLNPLLLRFLPHNLLTKDMILKASNQVPDIINHIPYNIIEKLR